jgi:Cdc6-like AAA superfamily ATPase
MTSFKIWSREFVAEKRKQKRDPQEPDTISDLGISSEGKFHDAAAVLSSFEINGTLQPVGRDIEAENAELERLIGNSILVSGTDERRLWALKNDVRKDVLRRLGTRTALLSALKANVSRPRDTLQQVFELYVFGSPKRLAEETPEELSSTLQVVDWLSETELRDELPTQDEVRRWVEMSNLLSPFRLLVGDHFRGRTKELQLLREYVEVLRPQSREATVRRTFRRIMSLREKPPLLIWGPGGIGKSTLLAKFILEHTIDSLGRLPFLYLDCDRPGLDPKEPLTLLVESVRQLGIEFPEHANSCEALRKGWLKRLSTQAENQMSERLSLHSRREFIEDFWLLVDELGIRETPLLLVLDTFEEVQFRSEDSVAELWRFLEELQGVIPEIRTVIAGRARIPNLSVEELPLEKLDIEAAQGFLTSLGITDLALARVVAEQMQGNPLSLRLAAQILRNESAGQDGVQEIKTREWWGQKVDDSRIQGQLYARILNHVHDEDVRKLAHPGLILRRITPDLIRLVLAEPCGLGDVTPSRALQLFNSFKREVSLVTASPSDPLELYHRSDVRGVMLQLMRAQDVAQAKIIHTKAVDFYKSQPSGNPKDRAEEIYHRLWLEQPHSEIEPRFVTGVEDYLQNALEELPPSVQPYLASRIGIAVDLSWEKADLKSWEAYAKRRAEDLLQLEHPEEALRILRKRDERTPDSPLYLLEAQALERLGRLREASIVARTGIANFGQRNHVEILRLYALAARADELLGEVFDATELVETFRNLASTFPFEAELALIGVSYVRRMSKDHVANPQHVLDAFRQEFLEFIRRIPIQRLRSLAVSNELSVLFQRDDPALATALGSQKSSSSPLENAQVAEFVYGGSGVEKQTLRDILLDRYPGPSLLNGAVSSIFGVSLSEIADLRSGPLALVALQVIDWADQRGRTPQLIEALSEQFPDEPRLGRFRSTGSRRLSSQVIEGLTDGSRPFINRYELRNWVGQLDARSSPVLIVNGSRGSGKSYTVVFLQYVASQSEKFDLISIQFSSFGRISLFEFARTIARNAGWNPQSMPGSQSTGGNRYIRDLVAWLGVQAESRRKPLMIVLDDLDDSNLSPEIVDFVLELTRLCTRAKNLLLVLLGLPANRIPIDCAPFVKIEQIQSLTPSDVEQFLRQLTSARFLPEDQVVALKEMIFEKLPSLPEENRNRVLQENLSTLVKRLADKAT